MKYLLLLFPISLTAYGAAGLEFGLERGLSGHRESIVLTCTEDPRAQCDLVMTAPSSKPTMVKVDAAAAKQAVVEFQHQVAGTSERPKAPESVMSVRWWTAQDGQRSERTVYFQDVLGKKRDPKIEKVQKAVFIIESKFRQLSEQK